jgi:hypothetical protein
MLHTLTRSAQAVAFFTTLIAIAFLSFAPLDASAGPIYKWVDKDGTVTFGSRPPESTPAQRVNVDTYVPPAQPATDEKTNGKEADKTGKNSKEKDKKTVKAKQPAKPEISAAEKLRLCNQARQDLAALQAHGQIRQKDANGNVSYMSEQQKQSRINADRRDIQKYCR